LSEGNVLRRKNPEDMSFSGFQREQKGVSGCVEVDPSSFLPTVF